MKANKISLNNYYSSVSKGINKTINLCVLSILFNTSIFINSSYAIDIYNYTDLNIAITNDTVYVDDNGINIMNNIVNDINSTDFVSLQPIGAHKIINGNNHTYSMTGNSRKF